VTPSQIQFRFLLYAIVDCLPPVGLFPSTDPPLRIIFLRISLPPFPNPFDQVELIFRSDGALAFAGFNFFFFWMSSFLCAFLIFTPLSEPLMNPSPLCGFFFSAPPFSLSSDLLESIPPHPPSYFLEFFSRFSLSGTFFLLQNVSVLFRLRSR